VACGEVRVLPLAEGEQAALTVELARGFDCGAGKGRPVSATVRGGVVGVIADGRGRPLQWARTPEGRRQQVLRWEQALAAYPE
jgi:hypothetical protein